MKKILVIFLVLVTVFSMFACQKNDPNPTPTKGPDTTQPVATEPPVGGQIITGNTTALTGDWETTWTNNAADYDVLKMIMDADPVIANQSGELVINNNVAKEVTTEDLANADGTNTKRFTVKLCDDLVWSNGQKITAADYVARVLLFSHPTIIKCGAPGSSGQSLVGWAEYKAGTTDKFKGVHLIDEYTYSVEVADDFIPYYYDMLYCSITPLPLSMWVGAGVTVKDSPEGAYFEGDVTYEKVGATIEAARWISKDRVTYGPYMIESFDLATTQAVLVINPNYKGNFEGQKPHVAKIIYVKADEATQIDALKTGAIDILDEISGGETVNSALDLVDAGGFSECHFDRNGYGKLEFQCDFGPTQFIEVRHAIAYLIDRTDFAKTFTGGYGSVVHGPYGIAMWMYKEGREQLTEKLNTYNYSTDSAISSLVSGGWTLDVAGNAYVSGTRYKVVTKEQANGGVDGAEYYKGCVTLADGRILMPLRVEWLCSENNPMGEALKVKLAQSPEVTKAGMVINVTEVAWAEMLNYKYRDASQGDQYATKTYGMFNLATNFTAVYDRSYEFTLDPEYIALGYNTNFIYDAQLDKLSMDMVYAVESGDEEGYLKQWIDFIVRWNELLPEIPLYSNVYYSVFNSKLKNFEENGLWGLSEAIVYAYIEE